MKMTFSALEDQILHAVLKRPQTTSRLLDTYIGRRGVSRAGFYKALASLKRKEVLLVKKGFVTVNKIWLASSYEFFKSLASAKREPSYLAQQVNKLRTDEELSYHFGSMADIDLFLINLIYDLLLLNKDAPVLIEESHEFFLLLNSMRTVRFMDEMKELNSSLYLLVHSSSPIDKNLIQQQLPNPAQGYATGKDRALSRVVHTVNDIVIELTPDKRFLAAIGDEYAKANEITDELTDTIIGLAERKQRHRIRVYRDSAVEKAVHARFRKHFANL